MKTMAERLQRDKVYDLIGIDLFKDSWPDELSLLHIIRLYSSDKDQELIKACIAGLEEATFNKDIEARRLAYLIYQCELSGGWKRYQLEAQEIEKVECAYKLKESQKIFNANYLIYLLLNSAEVRLNLEPIDIYKPIALYREKYITLDWFYSAQALSLWLEAVGESPSELLSAWFKSKGICLEIVEEKEEGKLNKKLSVEEFLPNLPKERSPSFRTRLIKEAVKKFINDHKCYPRDFREIWDKLKIIYKDNLTKINREETISVNGNNLGRDSCRTGFSSYKRSNRPKMDSKDNLDNL
jgi:hypothetical protein